MPASVRSGLAVNRGHPLLRGAVAWWVVLPHLAGGANWLNVLAPGQLSAQRFDGGSGLPSWSGSNGRPGGKGALDCAANASMYLSHARPALTGAAAFTVSSWVYGTSFVDFNGVWGKWDEAGTTQQFARFLSGGVQWFMTNTAVATANVSTAALTAGAWNHLAFTADGANLTPYLNGVAGTPGALAGPYLPADASNWHIGEARSSNSRAVHDDHLYLGRAWSAAEVAQWYNLSRAGYPGLLGRRGKGVAAVPVAANAATTFLWVA